MSWKNTLNEILRGYYKVSAQGGKAVSFATQTARREILVKGFSDLRKLGYKLEDVKGFKERHIMALAKSWEEKKLSQIPKFAISKYPKWDNFGTVIYKNRQ